MHCITRALLGLFNFQCQWGLAGWHAVHFRFRGANETDDTDLQFAFCQLPRWEHPGSHNPLLREVSNENSVPGEYL